MACPESSKFSLLRGNKEPGSWILELECWYWSSTEHIDEGLTNLTIFIK